MKRLLLNAVADVVRDVVEEATAIICTRFSTFAIGFLDGYYGEDFVNAILADLREPHRRPDKNKVH